MKKAIKNAMDVIGGEAYAKLSDPVKKMFLKMINEMDFIQIYKDTPFVQGEPRAEDFDNIPVVDHMRISMLFEEEAGSEREMVSNGEMLNEQDIENEQDADFMTK